MGEIITLNSGMYKYELPSVPRREEDILNYQYPKADQYWRTPIIKDVKHMTSKERINYIEFWRQAWAEGLWFFNHGEPTFITGIMVDHLTFMTFKGTPAEYFDHQRYDFYFRDLTRNDVKCDGRVWMKPRRYGMTMQEVTEATYSLLEGIGNCVGLQSDTPEKARTTLMDPILASYYNRPKWMRSDYYKPNGKVLISKLSLKSNMAQDDTKKQDNFINGWIHVFPTLPRAMDGNEMVYIVEDETWKWQTSSPKEVIETNMKVLHGRHVHGKLSVLSTMGDSDDYINSVMDGCDIISKSNPHIRNENGRTLSGLYEYFVSAIYSFDIPPDIFEVDKYGFVNKDKHLEYINNKLKMLDKNSKSYVFEKRRLPLCKEDALMSANMKTYFRKVVINSRLNDLRSMPPDEKLDVYRRGNLRDIDGFGNVEFYDDPEGPVLIAAKPFVSFEKRINMANRFRRSVDGIFFPPINPEGVIGYDPINYKKGQTSSNNLSRAAATGHKKFDYVHAPDDEEYLADVKAALILYRPDDPHDANKLVMQLARYTGYMVMHERSVMHVEEDFTNAGMLPFLMQDDNKLYGISPGNAAETKDGFAQLQARYAAPKDPEAVDQLATHPFEDSLTDLDNFDINNTTPFDVAMSEIRCENGLKRLIRTNATDSSEFNIWDFYRQIVPVRIH